MIHCDQCGAATVAFVPATVIDGDGRGRQIRLCIPHGDDAKAPLPCGRRPFMRHRYVWAADGRGGRWPARVIGQIEDTGLGDLHLAFPEGDVLPWDSMKCEASKRIGEDGAERAFESMVATKAAGRKAAG